MCTWAIPGPSDEPPPRRIEPGTWEDRHGRIYKYTAAAEDIRCVHDPVNAAKVWTVEDFAAPPAPSPPDPRSWAIVEAVVGRFAGEKFICGPGGGEIGMLLPGGMVPGMLLLAEQPEVIDAAVAQALAWHELNDPLWIHPRQDGVLWGAGFGHKTGCFISPRSFRRHFLAANRRRVEALHDRGITVLKHCCGNIWGLLDQFIEIGYDAYQSIQPTADMDLAEVKRRYGDRMTLWGGVAVEHLVDGTMAEVRADVRRAMEVGKPGGHFILGSSHSIATGTRYDNFMAMLDEYHRWAAY
jgi:hypothetical protein